MVGNTPIHPNRLIHRRQAMEENENETAHVHEQPKESLLIAMLIMIVYEHHQLRILINIRGIVYDQ
jgi:hypothetical protein